MAKKRTDEQLAICLASLAGCDLPVAPYDREMLNDASLRFMMLVDRSPVTDEWLKSLGGSRGADMVVDDAVGRQAWHDPDAWTFYGPSVVLWVKSHPVEGCRMKERDGDIDMEIRSKGHARLAFRLLEVEIEE